MNRASVLWLLAVASMLGAPLAAQQKHTNAASEPLERSSWFAGVSAELQRAEYRFSRVPGAQDVWSAPSRAQNLRSRVSLAGLEVIPRSVDALECASQWKLVLATRSFGRSGRASQSNPAAVRLAHERIELEHGRLTEWFVNDERGLEQGWTIASAPRGAEPLWIGLEVGGDLYLRIDAGGRSGRFVDASGELRLRYTGLFAFDATGRELDARLMSSPHGVGIEVDDAGAVYPLTVDPLLTGPAWTAASDQASAAFGVAVASAGDVNGDGYSDAIVGASLYDNGEAEEGRAFVFLGSASGLSNSPDWTAESDQVGANFGGSVATAGDVDGDGYSDVIIGVASYDSEDVDVGGAFVFLGSASGLGISPAWNAESDQTGSLFGSSVSCAGDINGDGFSDVMVGASEYANGESGEGRAYMYLGSGAGLLAAATWTAESDQVDAHFGISVSAASDVDGDGFGDVIVGAADYDDEESDAGGAFVFLGSAIGLANSPAWTASSEQTSAGFGCSVATAGDVNADGFGDVIVGASAFDNGESDEGAAFVYLGSITGLSTSAAWTAESDQLDARFGSSVAMAGDVNGDGYCDVLVGAPLHDGGDTDEGRVYVYLGSAAGLATSAVWTAESDQATTGFGQCVAPAGDVDGDGFSDVIVGASAFDDGETDEGRVFVYFGSGSGLATNAAGTIEADQVFSHFGASVAPAGDVNGDGYSDVIVGSYQYDNGQANEGRAFVYLGSETGLAASPAWTAESNQAGAQFGFSVASAGDVNGDGYGDVIVGSVWYDNGEVNEGRVFVYRGSSTGLSTSAVWTAESNQANVQYGYSVATAGDVNGDGFGDVIVGAYLFDDGESDEGRVFVYSGSSAGLSTSATWTAASNQADAWFGYSVGSAGDVDGNGYSDVIVGSAKYDGGQADEGRAFVYRGSRSGLSSSATWTAESDQSSASFGHSVARAGDVNGDGYSDVIVGAYQYDNGQSNEGRTFVYLGSAAGLSPSAAWTAESDQSNSQFGYSVASAGDVNGDGYCDVIVGSALYDNGQSDEGRAFMYLGSSTGLAVSPAWTAESDQADAFMGWSVASAGDVNGDGYSDVIVGAITYEDGQFDEGRAFVYSGNEGRGGWSLAPRQRQADDTAPIDLLGRAILKNRFRIRLDFERELSGFTWASGLTPKARLQWEVRALRAPLDGNRIDSGTEQTITGSPLSFNELVEIASPIGASLPFGTAHQVAAGAYHWRVQVRTNNPLFPVTPWVTFPGNGVTETKLRVGPLPATRAPH